MGAFANENNLIVLRPVTPGDDSFLAGLYASTRWGELAVTSWSDDEKAAFCRQQFDAQTVHYREHYPGASLQVIEKAGAPVGRLYVARWEREIRIMDIALLPEFRGSGVGTRLLRELQEEARSTGKSLTIHVERFNPALRWYQRLGFKMTEDKGVYLLMEWRGAPSEIVILSEAKDQ